jgi:hypothetical protein
LLDGADAEAVTKAIEFGAGVGCETRCSIRAAAGSELAHRIDQRAKRGLTVHLKPATARTVAITLCRSPPDLRDSHPHHGEDWTHEPHQVLAYCTSATLAIGAWERYAPQYPQRNLIATWGVWIARGSKRDRA